MIKPFQLPDRNTPIFSTITEFHFEKKLGEGAFSVVYKAIHNESQASYAIKIIDFDKIGILDQENIEKEIHAHKVMNHKNVIRLYDFFKEENIVYLVMEYCNGGNLFNYLTKNHPLTDDVIQKLFKQTVDGVDYIHKKGYINRDIKPENILLDRYRNVKICDFGWASHKTEGSYRKLKAGTIPYMSPESLMGEYQEFSSDIWSLGVLLYELYNNKEPYSGMTCHSQLVKLSTEPLVYIRNNVPETVKSLIVALMTFNKDKRYTLKDIYNNPYLQNYETLQRTRSIEANRKGSSSAISVHPYEHLLHGEYEQNPRSVSNTGTKKSSYQQYFANLAKPTPKVTRKPSQAVGVQLPIKKTSEAKKQYTNFKTTEKLNPTPQPALDPVAEKPRPNVLRGYKALNTLKFVKATIDDNTSTGYDSPLMSPVASKKTKRDMMVAQSYQIVNNTNFFNDFGLKSSRIMTKKTIPVIVNKNKAKDTTRSKLLSSSVSFVNSKTNDNKKEISGRVENLKRAMTPILKRPVNTAKSNKFVVGKKPDLALKSSKGPDILKMANYVDKLMLRKPAPSF